MSRTPERRALVTGCSTGIGRATVVHLAARGWRVFAGVRREEDGASLRAEGGSGVIPLIADVTDAAQLDRAIEAIRADGDGSLDALVNNAARVTIGPIETTPIEEFRRLLEVNLLGVVGVTQRCLPLLRLAARRGGGEGADARIVNVGSTAGIVAWPFSGAYVASKFALEGLSDTLRLELDGSGIGVSVIITGSVRTPIWKKTNASFEASAASMPAELEPVYGARLSEARRAASASPDTIEPDAVVHAIDHALNAARPRPRYVVGPSARKQWWLRRFLSDRAADRVRLAMIRKRAGGAGAARGAGPERESG